MGFRQNAWATCWEVRNKDEKYSGRFSISRKKDNGEYVTTWTGWASMYGEAGKKAAQLTSKDRIQIKECDVTNRYDKEKDVTYTNYAIYDFDFGEDHVATTDDGYMDFDNDEELPFN